MIHYFLEVSNYRDDSYLGIQVFLLNRESLTHRSYSHDRRSDELSVGKAGLGDGQAQWPPITFASAFEFSGLDSFYHLQ